MGNFSRHLCVKSETPHGRKVWKSGTPRNADCAAPRPRQLGRLADLAVPENFHDPLPGLESSAQECNSPTKLRFFPTIPTPQSRHCDVTSPKWAQSEQEAAQSNPGSHVRQLRNGQSGAVRSSWIPPARSARVRRSCGENLLDWNNDGSDSCHATLAVL